MMYDETYDFGDLSLYEYVDAFCDDKLVVDPLQPFLAGYYSLLTN